MRAVTGSVVVCKAKQVTYQRLCTTAACVSVVLVVVLVVVGGSSAGQHCGHGNL